MLNPSNDSRSPLSSRIALPVALLLAGVFGLAVAWVQPSFTLSKKGAAPIAHRVSENPGTTSNQPSGTMPTTEGEDLIAFCSRHVTATRSFVVFKHGTCVVINEPCDEPMTKAKEVLARCTDPSAAFLTEPTTDGDMIVTFKEPVFHRFTPGEMVELQPWLREAAPALLTPQESVKAGDGWVPPNNARVGLLARRRMLKDASEVVPVKLIRARERAVAAR
ncbi:MAG: hypothetical protein H7A49_10160 [Akkermansiaceae bacterium]|nr:hypothetical protein [Akkermansiaceae bacterium]MCP5544256.1 hypothetical protein [Akkermansiaceae bacterium]MCP5547020.1 hypothetical protein [Akkermansiaceae bacterium]